MSIAKKISAVLGAILLIIVVSLSAPRVLRKFDNGALGGNTFDRTSYDAVGTASASTTLVSLTSTSTLTQKVFYTYGLENLHLDMQYTPATSSAYLVVQVEGSNDDGTTYFPLSAKQVNSGNITLFATSTVNLSGIPILFPGTLFAVSGTQYSGMFDSDMVADHVRITARENATSGFGKTYIRATFTTKK